MGQSSSAEVPAAKETHSAKELQHLFQTRVSQLFTATELAAIKRNLPSASAKNGSVSASELASFLGLSALTELDDCKCLLEILHQSFVRLGSLPFPQLQNDEAELNEGGSTKLGCKTEPRNEKETQESTQINENPSNSDTSDGPPETGASGFGKHPEVVPDLAVKNLLVAVAVHMQRVQRIWKDANYVALLFWAFSQEESDSKDWEKREPRDEHYTLLVLQLPAQEELTPGIKAKTFDWNTLETLRCLAAEQPAIFRNRYIHAEDLCYMYTLMLVCGLLSTSVQSSQLDTITAASWRAYYVSAKALVRHYTATDRITYDQFCKGMRLTLQFQSTFRNLLQKQVFAETPAKHAAPRFTPSRLVNEATLSQVAVMLGSDNVAKNVAVTKENMVELYNGSKSGFSIRSLELKIFKWHAPTIFFVAGKRVKSHNKRYEAFDAEFPRHFRSNEPSLQPGQNANDRLVYAVYISEPWKISNKANFGNEESVILALQPRAETFLSISASAQQGKLVYFNTQGMGIGFGNDQPINKNLVRRYIPGRVSLTIEANLEFAVFRHISHASANSPNHFHTASPASEIPLDLEPSKLEPPADYEDRFIITDLEVWGIGSTKELDEQKKNWEWEEKQAQARQSVNVRNMGEDRAFMEMVGLVGNHGSGGSV